MGDRTTERLDNFTDAAFAFALSWLLVGQDAAPANLADLRAAAADIPAFAIGFAIIATFWITHVRWRKMRGEGGALASVLTIALVFLVLIYIRPLQGMALSLSRYLGGAGRPFTGDLGGLFLIYGAGFAAMSAATAGLFLDAARDRDTPAAIRRTALGEFAIWSLLTVTGLVSIAISLVPGLGSLAPWAYATLPATVTLLGFAYPWDEPPPSSDDAAPQSAEASPDPTRPAP